MTDPIPWLVQPDRAGDDTAWAVLRDGIARSLHASQSDAALTAVELAMGEAGQGVPGWLRVLGRDGDVQLERHYPLA